MDIGWMDATPKHDEVEVSVFGPGYGEGIVVHVGDHEWIVVDSCIEPLSKQPAILDYFHAIGSDPSAAVKLVIATHWHDDHVRGLGTIVRACENATFVCSAALQVPEFLTLVKAYGTRPMLEYSGVQEFSDIIASLETRGQRTGGKPEPPTFALVNRCLWRRESQSAGSGLACEVHALSPSDAAILLAHMEIASLVPRANTPKGRVVSRSPNHVAVVLWIRVGNVSILLGSDLEETSDPRTGWSVIVTSEPLTWRNASVFKVPHHGSAHADHPRVWADMLVEQPVAVLTPFNRGRVVLPRNSDITRIRQRTRQAFMTARPTRQRHRRPRIVEELVRGATRGIHPVQNSFGHVRLRTNPTSSTARWQVELFGDALPLEQIAVA
jgi:beta-lactamase superfamily II metal-dependent hydrolase